METNVPMSVALVATTIVILAAVSDLKSRYIPNPLVVSGAVLGLVLNTLDAGWQGLGTSLAGFAAGFLLMLPGYLLRFTGGGDVKLLAALGSLLGPGLLFNAFILTVFVAAGVAVLQGIHAWLRRGAISPVARYGRMLAAIAATRRPVYVRPDENEVLGQRVPLAPAIALGTLAAVWLPW